MTQSVSPFQGNGETLYLFVFTQFGTEGYGEVAEPKRFTLSWNCSEARRAERPDATRLSLLFYMHWAA
ncbi:hypothetical protein EOA27_17375 [Mesorhizobium sp. M2A.F.Ca.ET.037.01.1.1]|uniref:hypothetical protein n=1 Tax=unclassified Mesorhizobium TaxID=325217 RepID=UPI000F751D97|nr:MULTISPECIES: hypothetical protein [unclassified Mesorhizobium]RUX96658.1 hypothetical protein EOA25_28810 [Mesorhizobium sp. M2A.F.Ca.ET.040.01.1.1]RVC58725.1 hypothetical protein EN759_33710 [Mesorhizobium sp. M00.F.Ca.ET.038.03.1.1]RVC67212.1 hypothetical protein EN766_31985 [Mesorhizobium sp. M2A.F.Ca.ET.046.02.1.1]AZO38214.1 hypothetical protein EJ072_30000 [Mesorhizobium sp. M2A.F.Ca.ET.046.03.2.1]RUX14634.1 hypothetical protein EOA27_17375 [Mesorhizobium sp. M2A.F.Ca.ET.037.01.1.1]